MNGVVAILLASFSAVLLVLLFPNYDLSWLAPVALTPLLIACAREKSWKRRFLLGHLCGILYWFGLCNWIQFTLANHADVSGSAAWALFVLFCIAKGLHMAVFAVFAGVLLRSRFALPMTAALWVAIEWTHGVLGFEWLALGNAGSEMSLLLRLAPFTGVWGLSFVFAMMSAAFASIALRQPRAHLAWLLPVSALWALPAVPRETPATAKAILLQPNQDEGAVWTGDLVKRTLRQMSLLSLGQTFNAADLEWIVWPEDPGPFYEYDPAYLGTLQSLAQTANANVIAGAVARSPSGSPLNSAIVLSPGGKLLSRYSKMNLVPFGEFVPWPFKQITKQVSTEAGEFEPGHQIVVTQAGTRKEGTFICYEAVFPGFIRQFVDQGAEVLFNISNDGWFGKTAARYQHLRIVRMRAVENRRWILRATNNGVTVAIDPAGRVVQQAPEYSENASLMGFRYTKEKTVYTRFGDWFVVLCALVTAAGLLEGYFKLRKKLFNHTLSGRRGPAAPASV